MIVKNRKSFGADRIMAEILKAAKYVFWLPVTKAIFNNIWQEEQALKHLWKNDSPQRS